MYVYQFTDIYSYKDWKDWENIANARRGHYKAIKEACFYERPYSKVPSTSNFKENAHASTYNS
jgi:hypothetical protein